MARFFPLRLIPEKTEIDFIGRKWFFFGLTIAAVVLTSFLLVTRGLNFGIDFTGGVVMEIRTPQDADLGKIRGALSGLELGEVALQNFEDPRDVMIRVQAKSDEDQAAVAERVKVAVNNTLGTGVEFRKVDYVGPQVGSELMINGSLALTLSFAAMLVYIWFRFEWQFGVGGILALIHDAYLTLGFYAITQIEFNLTSVAAILTIVGYSINDSVVIYDRIRENLRKYKKMPLSMLLNLSVNETLARTILTSGTTFLACLSLVLVGGETLKSFSSAMLFGIIIGTYSSIYVSATVLDFMNLRTLGKQAEPDGQSSGEGAVKS